jgi:hypothetical protein
MCVDIREGGVMIRPLLFFFVYIVILASPAAAVNITTQDNRSVNLSQNINIIIKLEASAIPMTGAQVTFNYDPSALKVNWVRKGDFLYYATDDSKIWHTRNEPGNGTLLVIQMVLFDTSIAQTKASTLMTVNIKPLRKGYTFINLSKGVLVVNDFTTLPVGGLDRDYRIRVT